MAVGSNRAGRDFTREEVSLAETIAGDIAGALENARLRVAAEEAAVTAERTRLARELHDAVTQALFSASLIAETLPIVWERHPEEGRRGLRELRRLTQGAMAEMRSMLLELRPAGFTGQKLDVLIRQLTDAMMARTRMPVTTTVTGDHSLPDEVKLALYRVAQEALNNIAKHARASQAKVYLDCKPGRVTLRVSDDGRGFAPDVIEPHQLGVGNMRERAGAIGAEFTLASQPGQGTEITVTWENTEREVQRTSG
jgi:signal transduction histidine kinase